MKVKNLVLGLTVLIVSIFFAQAALAACSPGKTETTIINPAGKVISICVPDAAIPNIGGPGDIVIPAICPCFDQADIEYYLTFPNITCEETFGETNITGETCTLALCGDGTRSKFNAAKGPADQATSGNCYYPDFALLTTFNNSCSPKLAVVIGPGETAPHMTEAEAAACVAIIETFIP